MLVWIVSRRIDYLAVCTAGLSSTPSALLIIALREDVSKLVQLFPWVAS